MLENIKSSFFIQKLFGYVTEKKKLKLVEYNKAFQNYINISINNYIHFTAKYIIYDRKGKEYDYKDNLLFEGEYLNGERNGKGKEYNNNGYLIFEGEFKNGKRWNDIFKGSELKDGKGYVKEYNK